MYKYTGGRRVDEANSLQKRVIPTPLIATMEIRLAFLKTETLN